MVFRTDHIFEGCRGLRDSNISKNGQADSINSESQGAYIICDNANFAMLKSFLSVKEEYFFPVFKIQNKPIPHRKTSKDPFASQDGEYHHADQNQPPNSKAMPTRKFYHLKSGIHIVPLAIIIILLRHRWLLLGQNLAIERASRVKLQPRPYAIKIEAVIFMTR